jgi:hypothetical protein
VLYVALHTRVLAAFPCFLHLLENASASAPTRDCFAGQCVLIRVRRADRTLTDRYLSGHFGG